MSATSWYVVWLEPRRSTNSIFSAIVKVDIIKQFNVSLHSAELIWSIFHDKLTYFS